MTRLIKGWGIIVSYTITVLAVTVILMKSNSDQVNNWVLAYSTITLVFVTIYYAMQTQCLVDQERKHLDETIKKREYDYLEKRMNEFYGPFLEKLNILRTELAKDPPSTEKLNELNKKTQFFLWQKSYMISRATAEIVGRWHLDFVFAEIDRDREAYNEFVRSEMEVRDQIKREMDEIEARLRDFYKII